MSIMSDSLLGKDSFDRQCVSVISIPLRFYITDFVSAIKQNVSIDLWYNFLCGSLTKS